MRFADDDYDENARRSVTDVSEQINEYNLFLSKNTNPNQPKLHFQNAEMESLDYEPIDNALTQSTLLSKNMSVCYSTLLIIFSFILFMLFSFVHIYSS